MAVLFLLPALVLLGALVVYPIGYSVWRSLYDANGSGFVGLDNYGTVRRGTTLEVVWFDRHFWAVRRRWFAVQRLTVLGTAEASSAKNQTATAV